MKTKTTEIDSYSVSLTRDINAPIESVFQAWTDPDLLIKWFGPKEVTAVSADVDLTIGGQYQFKMKEPDGNIVTIGGTYQQIHRPNKLVFTWILDGQGCHGSDGYNTETLVTIEFQEIASSTRIVLIHDFLPSEESKNNHKMGWIGSFDCLETVFVNPNVV